MSDQPQGSSEHRCSKCNQTFNSSDELRRHNGQAHGQSKHQTQGQNPNEGQQKSSHAGSNR